MLLKISVKLERLKLWNKGEHCDITCFANNSCCITREVSLNTIVEEVALFAERPRRDTA